MDSHEVLCSGVAERIGLPMGMLTHKIAPDSDHAEKIVKEQPFPSHKEAMELVIQLLTDPEKGVIRDKSEIYAIGHRVLHGGEAMTEPKLVDDQVKQVMRANLGNASIDSDSVLMPTYNAQTGKELQFANGTADFSTEWNQNGDATRSLTLQANQADYRRVSAQYGAVGFVDESHYHQW